MKLLGFSLSLRKTCPYGISLGIKSECGKMPTRITPNANTFHAVSSTTLKVDCSRILCNLYIKLLPTKNLVLAFTFNNVTVSGIENT